MTGRPGGPYDGNDWRKYRVVPRSRTPCVPVFLLMLMGLEAKDLLDFQGRRGITSVVRWNLRPVIFGVEVCKPGHCIRKALDTFKVSRHITRAMLSV